MKTTIEAHPATSTKSRQVEDFGIILPGVDRLALGWYHPRRASRTIEIPVGSLYSSTAEPHAEIPLLMMLIASSLTLVRCELHPLGLFFPLVYTAHGVIRPLEDVVVIVTGGLDPGLVY